MDAARCGELEKIALEVKKDVVKMLGVAKAGGFKKSVGIADILVYLYWENMSVFPGERSRQERDRFVLGKGSATPALYACLARRGFFSREELWSYSRLGAMLQGYPDIRTPGVDAPWGSHGGGIGIACGMAESLRAGRLPSKVFCLMDEHEMNAGVAWESVIAAASGELGNILLMVHSNVSPGKISSGLEAFGWSVLRISGDNYESIDSAFSGLDYGVRAPKAIVFSTGSGGIAGSETENGEDSFLSRDDVEKVISLLEGGTGDVEPR
jgi:transketolase